MVDALRTYRSRRNFARTPEPDGEAAGKGGNRLIVQHHFATRDHYDLRLEVDGVLASWAVTRGPSANPKDKRLAVRTEDHPLSYADFEGLIPKGEYGGGTVILWEYTTFSPANGDPGDAIRKGEIKFVAHGERMKGRWVLVRMHPRAGDKHENWLLIKERDPFVEEDDSLTSRFPDSVSTARTRQQIEKGAPKRKTNIAVPEFVEPQLCSSAEAPPEGDDWTYELKYDGYRLQLAFADGAAKLYTRSGLDWTEKFRPIADEAGLLKAKSGLIDGEAVVLDSKGVSQFPALVAALERKRPNEIVFVAFDILFRDGKDLRKKPLAERRKALRAVLPDSLDHIRLVEHIAGEGKRVFDGAVKAGAEGVIAKDATSAYVSSRSHSWVKVKGYPRLDVVIVGFKPSDKQSHFGSLHAAIEEPNGKLRYVGGIGTGYDAIKRAAIHARLAPGATAKPAYPIEGELPKDVRFAKTPLRAEIRFGGFTGDGHLRQARFLALRDDLPVSIPKPEPEEPPKAAPRRAAKKTHEAPGAVTHADRVVYPADGFTKGEIADYYAAVADRIAPHLKDRPLSIVRAPSTIEETFFQRHPLPGMERGITPVPVEGETYMALDGKTGLRTAAQFGAIELHGWMSRIEAIDAPDRMVFDLDPDDGLGFAHVVSAAKDIAATMKSLGLKSWPLLSGGKGVHVVIPLDGQTPYAQTEAFAKGFAQALAAHQPARFVATMSKQRRKGRIFVDWLRNKKSATAILPWSLRARAGAPVAVPVTWDELDSLGPGAFNIRTARDRKDPWRGFFAAKQKLPAVGALE